MNLANLHLYAEECNADAIIGRGDLLKLIAVAEAAQELSAVSGLRAEFMQDELSALNEALADLTR